MEDVFGFNQFLDGQLSAISSTLQNRDTFVILRTGGGKSLTYQLPALIQHRENGAVTFVVGPLLALKKDQMGKCEELGIPAASIDGSMLFHERDSILARLYMPVPDIALFFVTPEMVSIHIKRITVVLTEPLI